jgi:hypothetical protein
MGNKFLLFFIIVFLFISCDKKFNKAEWVKEIDDLQNYPQRDKMLADLTKNYKLQGLSYWQLTGLLGKPQFDYMDSTYYYSITIEYGAIDPIYTKSLVFWLRKDSVVQKWKVVEYKK